MDKVFPDAKAALHDLRDGAVIMSGGFGLSGNPEHLIQAINELGVRDLTVISNNCGTDWEGLGILLQARQIKKMVSSYVGENANFEQQFLSGELEVELSPQGTLAERIRAGGAGIRAFYTPTSYGTPIAEGKDIREFDGVPCVMETALKADFAIVKAHIGDTHGNLIYRMTARNFNPMMATAGKITIAEVEHIVPAGELDPEHIHTSGIYVQRIIKGTNYKKPIEQRTTRPRP